MDVEMSSFTLSTFGGVGIVATTAYRQLASLLAAQ